MTSREKLLKILYLSLTEIKLEATELKNNKLFGISSHINNLPLEILKAKSNEDFDTILVNYIDSVKDKKALKNIIKNAEKMR